jgi:nucleoside-diphosphate-sugar epimerase
MATPILVTGAAGRVGAVGRTVTELLLQQGKAVRAMVRHAADRAQVLCDLGAEVVVGDLLDLDAMHRVIAGCETMYFGMSVSDAYLAATVNAAVAKRYDPVAYFTEGRPGMGQATYAAVHSGVRRATGALGTATARP